MRHAALNARVKRRGFDDGGYTGENDGGDDGTPSQRPQVSSDAGSNYGGGNGALAQAGDYTPPVPQNPSQKIALANEARGRLADAQKQQETQTAVQSQNVNGILKGGGMNLPDWLTQPVQDPANKPGATNLPMLAAAGQFLLPTHSGGFSESLGKAFEAAVPVAQKQREDYEAAQLRQNQQQQTALYHQALTNNTANRNDSYATSVANRGQLQDAQASLALVKAQAGANPRMTTAQQNQAAIDDLKGKINPGTGQNYSDSEAIMFLRGVTQRTDQAASNEAGRNNRSAANLGVKATQIQNTQEWRQAQADARAASGDNANTNAWMARVTALAVAKGGGPTAVAEATKELGGKPPTLRNTPPTLSGGGGSADPIAQGRAAIARGADPAAVAARLKSQGIDPSGL